jgi:uncharacterized protein YhfF
MTAIRQMPYDDGRTNQGERQALELADRLRMLAASDPDLAQDLVEQLIEGLNKATAGAFDEHIEKELANTGANRSGGGHSPAGNS